MRPGTLPGDPTSSRPSPGAGPAVTSRERPRPVCQPAPTRPPSAPPLMTRPARPPLHRRARSPVSTARRRPIPSRLCPEPRAPGPDPLLPRPGRTPPALGGAPGRPWSCSSEACRSASSWLWWAAPGRSSPSCTWGRWRSGSSCGAAAGATCFDPRGLAVPGCSSPSARACALSAPWHTTRSTGWSRFTTPSVIAMLAETLVTAAAVWYLGRPSHKSASHR